jgi:hypothetical protein
VECRVSKTNPCLWNAAIFLNCFTSEICHLYLLIIECDSITGTSAMNTRPAAGVMIHDVLLCDLKLTEATKFTSGLSFSKALKSFMLNFKLAHHPRS